MSKKCKKSKKNKVKQLSFLQDLKKPQIFLGVLLYVLLTLALIFFIWNLWAAMCFSLAAYSVLWNDAVQTLMTYIHSNDDLPKKLLFGGVLAVLLWVIWYGYLFAQWGITYGRLDVKWYADVVVSWYMVFFPLILVVLTRYKGIPVSTSLLMLSIFSSTLLFEKIVLKSAAWYVIAFTSGYFIWLIAEYTLKRIKYKSKWKWQRKVVFWRVLQTCTTILLFSTWLMHDMVNIAVFLPREITFPIMLTISWLFTLALAYTFYIDGGPVWKIVTSKTKIHRLIGATMVDGVYFVILLIFKEWSNIPMSTTWVFIGLLAGRQMAIRSIWRVWKIKKKQNKYKIAAMEIAKDLWKMLFGLAISLVALVIVRSITGT
jgi:hypothetical protein